MRKKKKRKRSRDIRNNERGRGGKEGEGEGALERGEHRAPSSLIDLLQFIFPLFPFPA